MGKQKVHYFIRGYYYAPESYRALKKLSDFGKEIPIPMTGDEQGTMALYCFSKGFQQAIDYVKQVERQRLRKNKRFITYGVWTIEDPKMYIYSLSFRCRSDVCIQERMKCKKKLKNICEEQTVR